MKKKKKKQKWLRSEVALYAKIHILHKKEHI